MTSRFERRKDVVQELTESGAAHAGRIGVILTGAVREVTREIGDWLTDVIEMREAARRAEADSAGPADLTAPEPDGQALP
ncbi:MAG: hypothetical protein ACR2N4_04855 [Jatrophihabitans sp.]